LIFHKTIITKNSFRSWTSTLIQRTRTCWEIFRRYL